MDKKIFVSNSGYDLKKTWFVYSAYINNKGKRVIADKWSAGINKIADLEGRKAALMKLYEEKKLEFAQRDDTLPLSALDKVPVKFMYDVLEEERYRLRPTTYKTYTSKLNVFNNFVVNNGGNLNEEMFKDFVKHLVEKGYSSASIRAYRDTISWCYEKVGKEFPGKEVQVPKVSMESYTPFTEDEVTIMMAYTGAYDVQVHAYISFVFYAFIRPREELLHLRIRDIDMDKGIITVRKEISKNKRTQKVQIVPPLAKVIAGMELYKYPSDYYLFSKKGQPGEVVLGKGTLCDRHQKFLKRLGMNYKEKKVYSWKHTGNIMAVKAGCNVYWLQKQNRHHSLDQFMQYIRELGVDGFENEAAKFPNF